MTPERWQKVDELFHAALEFEPGRRAAFLAQACADDRALRAEVESLLASDERAGNFMAAPAAGQAASAAEHEGESLVGRQIDHYKVIKEIGRGGMGRVYLAKDAKHWDRLVALKLLLPKFTENKEHLRRFQQEAFAASNLKHPNVPHVYEVGQFGSAYFIVTEFVEGVTLRQHLARARVELLQALDIAIKVASALAKAHADGVVHRDIKPENIMLDGDGHVKVLDFGLVKLMEPHASRAAGSEGPTVPVVNTATGAVLGTVSYMSPEQLRGQQVDGRTDVWSLGVVLYELVTGRAPFDGATDSEVGAAILYREPAPLARYSVEAPAELQRMLTKALRKNKEERYQTINDLLLDLESLRHELQFKAKLRQYGVPGYADGVAGETGGGQTAVETERALAGRATTPLWFVRSAIRRHTRVAALSLALLVAGSCGALYQLLSRSDHFQKIKIDKLPYTDRATGVAVSPNGKYMAYVENDKGQQSIWIRPVDMTPSVRTDQPVRLVQPGDSDLSGLTFSHDGSYLYFIRDEEKGGGVLYRVTVSLEGAPTKLVEEVDTPVTLSPDSKRLAFVRYDPDKSEYTLITADAGDGGGERAIATRKLPKFYDSANCAWSPDQNDHVIICVAGDNTTGNRRSLVKVNIEDGTESPLTTEQWFSVGQVAWLGDGAGLVMTAAHEGEGSFKRLWYVSYPSGDARRINTGVNNYVGVSLSNDSKVLLTVEANLVSDFYLMPGGDASRAERITSSSSYGLSGLSMMPDGSILYVSETSGNKDIWLMDSDGKTKQLTFDPATDVAPSASPDGQYIVFVSKRTGTFNIWRMDSDGANPRPLTASVEADSPHCSPDGKWVVYSGADSSGKQALWKVSIDGGKPVKLSDRAVTSPVVAPDGKLIAGLYWDEQTKSTRVVVLPFAGGDFVKTFDISSGKFRWAPDGSALTYVDTRGGVSNIWRQPLAGGPAQQLTDFKELQIYSFDWAKDGKVLACQRGSVNRSAIKITDER